MTDQETQDQTSADPASADAAKEPNRSEILDELRDLGRNLNSLLQSAWESEERKKLQQEIENGLSEMRSGIKSAASGPTGQAIKADLEGLHQRLRTGEVEERLRSELVSALRTANDSIKKAAERKAPPPPPADSGS